MNALQTLKATRELLSNPAKWHKGFFAVSEGGQNLTTGEGRRTRVNGWPTDRIPVCFCTIGALQWTSDHPITTGEAKHYLQDALTARKGKQCWDSDIYEFNDDPETKHEDVLALLDESIKLAEDKV